MVRAWHRHVLHGRRCGPSWGEPEVRARVYVGGSHGVPVGVHRGLPGVCRLLETEAPEGG